MSRSFFFLETIVFHSVSHAIEFFDVSLDLIVFGDSAFLVYIYTMKRQSRNTVVILENCDDKSRFRCSFLSCVFNKPFIPYKQYLCMINYCALLFRNSLCPVCFFFFSIKSVRILLNFLSSAIILKISQFCGQQNDNDRGFHLFVKCCRSFDFIGFNLSFYSQACSSIIFLLCIGFSFCHPLSFRFQAQNGLSAVLTNV